jgi:hypothetical protein
MRRTQEDVSQRRNRAKRSGAFVVLQVMLLVSLGACGGQQQQSNADPAPQNEQPQALQAASFDVSNVGAFVTPDAFRRAKVKTDETGKYVVFDDMRFRVNEFETFGYQGHRWPNGTLPYDLAPDVRGDAFKRSQFEKACRLLTAQSGIGCMDLAKGNVIGKENHVYVVDSPTEENQSYVGRVGGRQVIEITSWSSEIIIAHELKHALGWVHEHQRPDRDAFVRINWANIDPTTLANFEIVTSATSGGPYDFESIMHYPPDAFSVNGQRTIEPLPPYENQLSKMGQRRYVSKIDLAEMIDVYGELGTEWCGLMRRPRRDPPEGCFFECYPVTSDWLHGRWWLCGSCRGAELCP